MINLSTGIKFCFCISDFAGFIIFNHGSDNNSDFFKIISIEIRSQVHIPVLPYCTVCYINKLTIRDAYGCVEPMEIVEKIFEPGEIPQIAVECLKLAGYIDGVKAVDDIKN